jgi:ribonuclease HI
MVEVMFNGTVVKVPMDRTEEVQLGMKVGDTRFVFIRNECGQEMVWHIHYKAYNRREDYEEWECTAIPPSWDCGCLLDNGLDVGFPESRLDGNKLYTVDPGDIYFCRWEHSVEYRRVQPELELVIETPKMVEGKKMEFKPRVDLTVDAATCGPVGTFTVHLSSMGKDRWIDGPVADRTIYTSQVLRGMLAGLMALKRPCEVRIFTSCRHAVDAANGWIYGWAKRDWKTSSGQQVRDSQLWEKFLELRTIHTIEVHHDPHGTRDLRTQCGKRAQARFMDLQKIAAV